MKKHETRSWLVIAGVFGFLFHPVAIGAQLSPSCLEALQNATALEDDFGNLILALPKKAHPHHHAPDCEFYRYGESPVLFWNQKTRTFHAVHPSAMKVTSWDLHRDPTFTFQDNRTGGGAVSHVRGDQYKLAYGKAEPRTFRLVRAAPQKSRAVQKLVDQYQADPISFRPNLVPRGLLVDTQGKVKIVVAASDVNNPYTDQVFASSDPGQPFERVSSVNVEAYRVYRNRELFKEEFLFRSHHGRFEAVDFQVESNGQRQVLPGAWSDVTTQFPDKGYFTYDELQGKNPARRVIARGNNATIPIPGGRRRFYELAGGKAQDFDWQKLGQAGIGRSLAELATPCDLFLGVRFDPVARDKGAKSSRTDP